MSSFEIIRVKCSKLFPRLFEYITFKCGCACIHAFDGKDVIPFMRCAEHKEQ